MATCQRTWLGFTHGLHNAMETRFYKLGKFIARRPGATILGFVVFTFLCSAGFLRFPDLLETDGKKLWIPQDSVSALSDSFLRDPDGWGVNARFQEIIAIHSDEASNVLTPPLVNEFFKVVDHVHTKLPVQLNDVCLLNPAGDCLLAASGTKFWNDNMTNFQQDVLDQPNPLQALLQGVKGSRPYGPAFPDGQLVTYQNIFGDWEQSASPTCAPIGVASDCMAAVDCMWYEDSCQGRIIEAAAIKWNFLARDGESSDTWEDAAIEYLEEYTAKSDAPLKLAFRMQSSLDKELERAVGGDIPLFAASFFIMAIAVGLFISTFTKTGTRMSLGSAGIWTIFFAIIAAYGLMLGVGVKFSSLVQVLPCIIVGIGVDDILILGAAWDRLVPEKLSPEEHVAHTLRLAGPSITTTSITNMIAFLLGSLTIIPAVHWFGFYAAVTVLLVFFYVLGMYVALMVLDGRRQRASRLDFLCCIQVRSKPSDTNADIEADSTINKNRESMRTRLFAAYGRFLTKPVVKGVVLVSFVSFLALNIWGVSQVTEGFDLADVTPDDSYVRTMFDTQEQYFREVPSLALYDRDIDYHTKDAQKQLSAFHASVQESQYTRDDTVSWLSSFQTFYRSDARYNQTLDEGYLTDKTTFYAALTSFRQDPRYLRFANSFLFDETTGDLRSTQSESHLIPFSLALDTQLQVDMLKDLQDRSFASELSSGFERHELPRVFSFFEGFVFFEQYVIIYSELLLNFVLSGTAVALVTMVLLIYPSAALATIAMVAMTDVALLASVYYWGMQINSVTVVQLIMAVGLVVDYSAHLAHAFIQQRHKTRNERVVAAMTEMGSSIALGGLTTFLGIMLLAFSESAIFRTFFKMFIGIIVLGQIHGLVLLPVVLSLVGPMPSETSTKKSIPSASSDVKEVRTHDTGTAPASSAHVELSHSNSPETDPASS